MMPKCVVAGLLPVVLLGAACATVPQQTGLMRATGQVSATTAELRMRMAEFGRRLAGELERVGDEIGAATDDPSVRRSAVLFKLSAVPAAQDAALRSDPVLAGLDTYAFGVQLRQFFASDVGTQAFGEHAALGTAALDRVRGRWDALLAAVSDSGISQRSQRAIQEWALEHPLEGVPFVRASLVGEAAGLLRGDETGLLSTVSSLEGAVARLEHRVAYLNETAGKQAAWLVGLALIDARNSEEASSLRRFLDTSTDFLASIPELSDAQREAIAAAVRDERLAVLREVDRQRVATLAELQRALSTVLEAVDAQRGAVAEQVTAERAASFDALRVLLAGAIEGQRGVIDHLFIRLAQLVAGLAILALVGMAGFLVWRRSPAS